MAISLKKSKKELVLKNISVNERNTLCVCLKNTVVLDKEPYGKLIVDSAVNKYPMITLENTEYMGIIDYLGCCSDIMRINCRFPKENISWAEYDEDAKILHIYMKGAWSVGDLLLIYQALGIAPEAKCIQFDESMLTIDISKCDL